MQTILIIQPAFLGDVILATALVEKLATHYPNAAIDFLVRKGNERILAHHPKIRQLLVFDRKKKWKSLGHLRQQIRKSHYDLVVNVHRHFSAGWLTAASNAQYKVGFRQNPFSFFFQKRIVHRWDVHEIIRNQQLIADFTDQEAALPKLYPSQADWDFVNSAYNHSYVTISPASVWATKQLPLDRWTQLLDRLPQDIPAYLLGGPNDKALCECLQNATQHKNTLVLAGKNGFLKDVALMAKAKMNYVLDSAPLHICSAMNAPVTAVFCSTSPQFGFGPLSDQALVIETQQHLDCRPCGQHGHKKCPKGHFKCAEIQVPDYPTNNNG